MSRLSLYLSKLFAVQALALFVIVLILVWITQALRLFDLVTAKGQDLLTLLLQASLTTPPLSRSMIYVCMGIGIVRALQALQTSRELHAIHSGRRVRALWSGLAVFVLGGVIAILLVTNWLEPAAKRAYATSSEQIAADLLGRALNPNKFSEVVPGLVVVIGGRRPDGTVTDFYADDTRDPKARRTYLAASAVIVLDEDGYNLSLKDGALQYQRAGGKFTEIGFSSYQLGLDRPEALNSAAEIGESDTWTLLSNARASGQMSDAVWREIEQRFSEASRVIALSLLAAAMAGFPHARRGNGFLPAEVIILVVGLGERALSAVVADGAITGHSTGAVIIFGAALLIIWSKAFGFSFSIGWRGRRTA